MNDPAGIARIGRMLHDFFVETPADSGPKGARLEPVASLAPAQPPVFEKTVTTKGGEVDFDQLYQQAGITSEGKFTVEKALEMIRKYPGDMPLETKRVSARIALEAMGKTSKEVLTDAAEKVQALDAYVETGSKEVQTCNSEADTRIAELQKQIEDWKNVKAAKNLQQEQLEAACKGRAEDIRQVIDFFTPDVAPETVEEAKGK